MKANKVLALILILVSPLFSMAQTDELVYSSGEVRLVKIIGFTEDGKVTFELKGEEQTLGPRDYITFYYEDKWYEYDTESKKFTKSLISPYIIKTNFFDRPYPGETPPKWRVQLDLLPLIVETSSEDHRSATKVWNGKFNGFYYNNRALSLDIGYQVHPRLVLNLPLRLGLSANKNITIEANQSDYYYRFKQFSLPYYLSEYNGHEISVADDYTWGKASKGHDKNLIFEGGLSPKFYPFGQVKNAIYIHQNFAFGIYDYKAVDYYCDYDTTINSYSYDTTIIWTNTYERAVQRSNQFLAFRYEAGFGIDLNIRNKFAFNFELAVGTHPRNKGKELDNVYFKQGNGEYQLIESELFDATKRVNIYYLGRFQLVYKF